MNKCIICGNTEAKPLYDGIVKCQKCRHVFSDLHLIDGELSKLYNKNYFCGGEYNDYIAEKKILQKNFMLRLKTLQAFLDPMRHKNLLEIGCAYGFFIDVAKGYFDTVRGIDIAEDGISYAREKLKLNVINADFLKYNFDNQKFDVVCLWDTIEHLLNPHLYLSKMSEYMSSGSLLAITTGDIESLNARFRKNKWRLIHPIIHVHYFSKKTLTKMLDDSGFDVVYNSYCGFYHSIDFIAYRLFVLGKKLPWLYNFLRMIKLTNINLYLNLYDIMYVIACKR